MIRRALLVSAALAAGCAGDPDVLATYDGGTVTRGELEAAIRALPEPARRPEDGDFEAWHARLVGDVALREILLDRARRDGAASEPGFARRSAELRKQVLFARFVDRELGPLPPIDEATLRERFEARRRELRRPARRLLFHLFRRFSPGTEESELAADMEALRRRIVAGERLEALAPDHSDSESRHRGGFLGWIEPGQVSPDLERVVFGLAEGAPSEVVRTRDGLHLFVVEAAVEERSYSFEEVRARLTQEVARERLRQRIRERIGEPPPGSFVPTRQELTALLREGEPRAIALRVGDFELELETLFAQLQVESTPEDTQSPYERAAGLIEQYELRERVALKAGESGLDRDPQTAEAIRRAEEQDLYEERLRRTLAESIDGRRLDEYFQGNAKRYATPLRVRLEVLRVDPGERPNDRLARLEDLRPELDAGHRDLASAANELGGSIEDLGWRTFDQLKSERPTLARLVVDLPAGRHTYPYQGSGTLEVARIMERMEPATPPLEHVEAAVRRDFVSHHGTDLLRGFRQEELDRHRYRVDLGRLRRLTPAEIEP